MAAVVVEVLAPCATCTMSASGAARAAVASDTHPSGAGERAALPEPKKKSPKSMAAILVAVPAQCATCTRSASGALRAAVA